MRVLALVGSDTGAVEAVARDLMGCLQNRGLSVSVIILDTADRDYDQPGKDSYRHRAAGAVETALVGERVYALSAARGPKTDGCAIDDLVERLIPVDCVLILAETPPQATPWIAIGARSSDDALAWVSPAPAEDQRPNRFGPDDIEHLCSFILTASQGTKPSSNDNLQP